MTVPGQYAQRVIAALVPGGRFLPGLKAADYRAPDTTGFTDTGAA